MIKREIDESVKFQAGYGIYLATDNRINRAIHDIIDGLKNEISKQ